MADGTAFCTSCGRPIVGYSVSQSGGAAAIAVPVPMGVAVATTSNYAGFWLRLVAAILDNLILAVVLAPLGLLVFASALPSIALNRGNPGFIAASILPRVFFFILLAVLGKWLYWALMESSSWQATLGKKALGLYVTDLEGKPASFGRTSGRFWGGRGVAHFPAGGALYYLVDCICAGLTEKKQAVHDMIASCLVMRKL